MMTCSLCDKPVHGRGMCSTHYMRWQRHGDPNVVLKERGIQPSYSAVHKRLTAKRGRAAGYLCVICGRPAQEWSYTNGSGGKPYSTNLNEYEPHCASCHRKLDKQRVANRNTSTQERNEEKQSE